MYIYIYIYTTLALQFFACEQPNYLCSLTVVAPFAIVDGILPERELLEVGVGLGEEADDEEGRASAVEGRHRLGRRWDLVTRRVDDDHR